MWRMSIVSPITIRLRILKVLYRTKLRSPFLSFTHHDPLEDTERYRLCSRKEMTVVGFTHHDPLEDTESF